MNDKKQNGAPDLSVVIINWRMRNQLEQCLPSIFEKRFGCRFEVVLVNKPSDDSTEQLLAERFPQVRLVQHEVFGIAEMRNVGIRNSRGRHILMLDADTEVLDDAFGEMVRFMDENPDVGGAGAKTLKPDGSLEYSAKRFYTLWTIIVRRTPLASWFPNNRWNRAHLMMDAYHDRVLDIDWMAGACFLMRRKTVEDVGVFDEHFYFGFEDVDWCFRAKKKGWRICYIPTARIVHHVQRSSAHGFNRMAWEHLRSGLRFYAKHYLRKGG
jgi:GT2 family glycosyltransferase